MANPTLDDIVGALSASELQRMCEQGRLLFTTSSDRLIVAADEIRNALARVQSTNPLLMGLDARASARRVTKPMKHAANLQLEAARAMQSSWRLFGQLYLGKPGSPANPPFDLNG